MNQGLYKRYFQYPEKKGFSSQTKRFPSKTHLSGNPGPGSYDCISSPELSSRSFSTKGTSGFVVSKSSRKSKNFTPGPDAYNLQTSFVNKSDFNTGVSRVFRLPVVVQLNLPKSTTPAPNQYDVGSVNPVRISSVGGTASFLSKTRRDAFHLSKNVPAPGYYDVSQSFIRHSSNPMLSPFKSKTERILTERDNRVPGPGAYNPYEAQDLGRKTISLAQKRGFYLALSAAPARVSKNPPSPGPGHYDVGICNRPPKHPKPTAAFASKTERIARTLRADHTPGPGFYDPQLVSKQSFLFNDSKVWLPI